MNSLLIYLIRNKTAKGMEIYKKLLYMSCFMDLIVSFWTFIVQPVILLHITFVSLVLVRIPSCNMKVKYENKIVGN